MNNGDFAEAQWDGRTYSVLPNEEEGGFDLKIQIGGMPPFSDEHYDTVEQVVQELQHLPAEWSAEEYEQI